MRLFLLLCLGLCLSAPLVAQTTRPVKNGSTLVVYYFYHFPRCTSCVALEAQTLATLKENFSEQLETGRIQWKSVNVGEKGNAHFEREYRLESSSVVLVKLTKGKRGSWKLLEKIWDIGLKDKVGVANYITEEVNAALIRWKVKG